MPGKNCSPPGPAEIRRGLPALVGLAAALLLLSQPAGGSEYVGLWRIDGEDQGITVSFPDNGLAGACVSLAGGAGGAGGEVRVESQIVRGRFQKLALEVSGALPPGAPKVALLVGGKVAWQASAFAFDKEPVTAALNGNEFVIDAKGGAGDVDPWELSFCAMDFMGAELTLRFTSDCAGFDFRKDAGGIRIIVDEDWAALGRQMAGGMALFEPFVIADQGGASLTAQSSFPSAFFRVSVLLDGSPAAEPGMGEPKTVQFAPGESGEIGFVVQVTTPLPADSAWGATLTWEPLPTALGEVDDGPDAVGKADTADEVADSGTGGCAADRRPSRCDGLVVLLVGALVGCLGMARRATCYRNERSRVIL